MVLNSPNRLTTPTQPCWTTFRHDFKNTTMRAKMATATTARAIDAAYGTDDHEDHLLVSTVGTPAAQVQRSVIRPGRGQAPSVG